jgi:PAS domain S-box-containing protein
MEVQPDGAAAEINALRRCINDLVGVVALPAVWTGLEPARIVASLLEALLDMLRLDVVYGCMSDPGSGDRIEILRADPALQLPTSPGELGASLREWLQDGPQNGHPVVRRSLGGRGAVSFVPLRLGLESGAGLLVAGSQRADFPQQTERLLMSVAVNQAAIALQEARLLGEQKRVARELDRRVAQRTAELAAAADELELHVSMLQLIPVAAWSVTPDGTPDLINRGWYEYTGQTPDYVTSHPEAWMATMHPEDRERAARSFWEGILSGNGFTMEARFLRARDQTYRWHLNRAVAVRDPQGNISRFVGTSTDIDDLKRAQEELRAMQAELAHMTRVTTMGELTASIAHEVNQPLSGIITNANTCLRMLAADPPNIDGARETARRTIRDANRASEVIKHLRALFAKKDIVAESVDLNDAAREIIALCSSDLQRNQVLLRSELADDLPTVTGDRVQLQQVILNLITNASEAMSGVESRPRELLVRTESTETDYVGVTVRDTGVGFDPRDADKLFAAFYTTKNGGMGIGLSVSRSIIESHQGRLWATANDGPGATFAFCIPVNRSGGGRRETPRNHAPRYLRPHATRRSHPRH